MLLSDYINKVCELTISKADNGLSYLEPMWKSILRDNQLDSVDIYDEKITPEELIRILELEVKKRNTINSIEPYVLNWVHDIITATIEPAILEEETDYIKNLTEYLKTKSEPKLKDED